MRPGGWIATLALVSMVASSRAEAKQRWAEKLRRAAPYLVGGAIYATITALAPRDVSEVMTVMSGAAAGVAVGVTAVDIRHPGPGLPQIARVMADTVFGLAGYLAGGTGAAVLTAVPAPAAWRTIITSASALTFSTVILEHSSDD